MLEALTLLIAANATPVVVAKLARDRAPWPVDFGHVMPDGERLFGSHKTWRGVAAGVFACIVAALWFGLPPALGAGFAVCSLAADAFSSMAKRRMRIRPGTETLGIDQLGEAVLPLAIFARPLGLGVGELVLITIVFTVLDSATARLRHFRWRSRPRSAVNDARQQR
jgi:CDP-2,3-bis-(O-geranylgeranyl)-sn-glycerol synthase